MKPAVITSKAASKHFDDIKIRHADIVRGIQEQSLKVAAYRQQEDSNKQMKEQQMHERKIEDRHHQAEQDNRERDYNMHLLDALKP